MQKKKILIALVSILILVGGVIAAYYYFEGRNYIKTNDARIAADLVNVTPAISGKLTSWNVMAGDELKAGDTMGWQDTNALATSAGLNPGQLNAVGSVSVGKAEITAPISGRVLKSSAQAGQFVSPGQTVAMIADTANMYVAANIEETKINQVKIGQDVEITVDALGGKKIMGKVDAIGQATAATYAVLPVQSSNGSFTKVTQLIEIKIRFPGMNTLNLVPGMSTAVKIHIR
ncbi:MAG: efflux RND transporter periplasmic adaptor subunit [Peptococcaceae bacterium]|jgi:multidrug resistance efflux pump|nr:efflux RND transporter periplasmic adaptor subunit [Peptococcaceae bacterium]